MTLTQGFGVWGLGFGVWAKDDEPNATITRDANRDIVGCFNSVKNLGEL